MKSSQFLVYFSLFFLGMQISVTANDQVDSLKQILKSEITDSLRAEVNYYICSEYMFSNQSEALKYAGVAIDISKIHGYKEIEANTLNLLGQIYSTYPEDDSAIFFHKESLKLYEELHDTLRVGIALNNIGSCYSNIDHFKEKISCYERALAIVRKYNHVRAEAKILTNIGHMYLYNEDYETAWKYSFKAADVAAKNNLPPITYNLLLMGGCYSKFQMFNKANAIFKDICQIYKSQNDDTHLYFTYSNLVILNLEKQQYDSAGFYIQKMKELEKEIFACDMVTISSYYIAVDSLDKALKYIKMVDDIESKRVGKPNNFMHYINQSIYFRKTDQTDNSLKVLLRINPDSIMWLEDKSRFYNELSEVYYQIGHADKAFLNLKKAMQWRDSLNIQNNRIRIIEKDLTHKFEREKEEQEGIQKQESLKAELEISKKQKLVLLLFIVMLFVLTITVIIYLNLQSKRRDNELLFEQKTAIEEKEQLAANLLKELNHRVKNNLQMVSSLFTLQQYNTSDPKVQEALNNASGRIDSITLLHQHMYKNDYLLVPGTNEYLTDLCNKIIETTGFEDRVHLKMDFENTILDLGQMTHLGLITNELLTNSIKYGVDSSKADNRIDISFVKENGKHILSIKNDLHKDYSVASNGESSKFGLKLVNTIVKQYNGSVNASFEGIARVDVVMETESPKDN